MSTNIKSTSAFLGKKTVSPDAPLPVNALMYLDFENEQYIRRVNGGSAFRSNKIGDVMSFTRDSIATYVGSNGLIQYAAAGEAVIEYDPITRACKGFRAEYQATNRIINSQNFQGANWTPTGVEITANDAISPDGNKTASKLIEAVGDGVTPSARTLTTAVTFASVIGEPYTFSQWFKANTGSVVQLAALASVSPAQYANFDLVNGKITRSSPRLLQANMEKFPNGWYRCSITISPTAAGDPQFTAALVNGNTAAEATPAYAATSVGSVYTWGGQAERAAGYTSYIPTSGAEAVRQSDLLTTPTGYTLISADKGSFFAEVIHPYSLKTLSASYQALTCAVVLDNGHDGGYYMLAYRTRDNMNGQAQWSEKNSAAGSTYRANIPSLAPVSNARQAALCMFNKTGLSLKAYDGQTWSRANPAAMPASLSRLCVGRGYIGSTNWFGGYIKKLVYWADELSEAEAEEFFHVL